jgi:hypothetical protein
MAKRYWVFCFSNRGLKISYEGNLVTLGWEQKRRFSGVEGDEVIELDDENFVAEYLLQKVDLKERIDKDKKQIWDITVTLSLLKKFDQAKNRKDYLYSFPRIKYFDEYSYRHFRNKYYRMAEIEFEAVINDDIFISRTLLGTAINSMHIDHRRSFVSHLVGKYPEVAIGKLDYEIIAENAIEYINNCILNPAICLQQSAEILRQIVGDDIFSQTGFQDENHAGITDGIRRQKEIADQYLTIANDLEKFVRQVATTPKGSTTQLAIDIAGYEPLQMDMQKEKRFDRLFTNKYLPIEL